MEDALDPNHLSQALRQDHAGILAAWMAGLGKRSWRVRQASSPAALPNPAGATALEQHPADVLALLEQRCDHLLRTLGQGLAQVSRISPGSAELREPIQLLSFTAGWMAGAGFDVGDVMALLQGLRAALGARLDTVLIEALEVVACEAHQAAVGQIQQARYKDAMSKAQVVCSLGPALPCLFLVGEPDRQALNDAVGRLMTLAVMRGARRILVDCATLAAPERIMPDVVEILLGYLDEVDLEAVVSAVPQELEEPRRLLGAAGVTLLPELDLDA